jgi:tRNA pseudouridine55 synthase
MLIDKPLEWTSFDVVKKLKYKLRLKKIGHAGTLDPLATGLLILCSDRKTKQIEQIQNQEKEYEGTLVLGQTTPSFDLETPVSEPVKIDHITDEQLHTTTQQFIGTIEQVPPIYSAIKVGGRRAYKNARAGKEVKMNPRMVDIKEFEIMAIAKPEVKFRVICSKGTYIRSLAHDFGQALKVGAYLSQLKRTRIGDYHLSDADTIQSIE